jgi:hypothetical protein
VRDPPANFVTINKSLLQSQRSVTPSDRGDPPRAKHPGIAIEERRRWLRGSEKYDLPLLLILGQSRN